MEALRAANRGMARAVCQGAKTAKRYAALGAGMEVDAQGYGREPTAMVRGVLSCLFVCLFVPNHLWTGKENLSWKCPSRRDDGTGTIEHYILYCPAYHAERQVILTTIAAAEGIKEKLLQQAQAL